MPSVTLYFDSARQAQQLFNNDTKNLRLLKTSLDVDATARDGWIKLNGEEGAINRVQHVFDSLHEHLISGNHPNQKT